ncbi:MAG: sugar transferase [Candidatus Limimorpha sp.]
MKWSTDRIGAFVGLIVTSPLLMMVAIIIKLDSKGPVFFRQTRIGQHGKPFKICKFRTMTNASGSYVTTSDDPRITPIGHWLRRTKIDCLSELFNVLAGQMSFVGPRPDVPGYADQLTGTDRNILLMKPGITGPASLKYRNEENLLAQQTDPQHYNDTIIWPDKVKINLEYQRHWTLCIDFRIIISTFFH